MATAGSTRKWNCGLLVAAANNGELTKLKDLVRRGADVNSRSRVSLMSVISSKRRVRQGQTTQCYEELLTALA